jgi:tetratricopeptide (TPR) repeat protein
MASADLLWSSDERVVRIRTRKTGSDGPRHHSLTGYVVAGGLVLTCAHDTVDAESREVWLAGDAEPRPAKVIWSGEEDAEGSPLDIALLGVPGLPAPKGRAVWGEYTDYVGAKRAWCIGFPRADKENGVYHAARVDGGFVPGEGSGRSKMLFTVDGANDADGAWWSGLSGAMIVDDKGLLGIVARYENTVRPRFHAVPASAILAQPRLRKLLGSPELLPLSDPHPLVRDPFEPLGEATDLKLITARYGQVPFVKESHGEALDKLMSWCLDESTAPGCDVSLRLLTGPAGAGKTRLAGELCRELPKTDPSWRAGFAHDDPQAPWGTHLPQTPLLIVFDYVERAAIATRVIALLRHLERLGEALRFPVRILLVSRAVGGWYEQMTDYGGTLLQQRLRGVASPRIELSRLDFGSALRRTHFKAAYRRFTAGSEGARGPDVFLDLVDGDQYNSPLLVHIAALLASRQEVLPAPERAGLRDRLLSYLLRRERERRWDFAPALSTTKVSPAQSDQALHAVAIMTLTIPTVREAAEFLKASELWADQPNASRREAAKALVRLYPFEGDESGRAAPIEPDLVSEYLVASVEDLPKMLTALHELPLGTEHYARMLHLLTLTCDHYEETVEHVYETLNRSFAKMVGEEGEVLTPEFLDQNLPRLIDLAVKQVVEHGNEAIANLLASMIEQIGTAEGVAEAIANTEFSTHRDDGRLARLGRVLYDLKIQHCREVDDHYGLIDALEGLAGAAFATQEVDSAFESLTEAVQLRRAVGAALPSEWALSALAGARVHFEQSDRYAKALTAAKIAIELHQAAGVEDQDFYRETLAAMDWAAAKLRGTGDRRFARETLFYTIQTRIEREMWAGEDYSFCIMELEILADMDLFSGSTTEALRETVKALRLRRDFDLPDVQACLGNFERIERIFSATRSADAAIVSETVELYRWLADRQPECAAEAAEGLEVAGRRLWWLGRRADAVAALEAAVSIRRGLPHGRTTQLELVSVLRDYALALWKMYQNDEALAAFEEVEALTKWNATAKDHSWASHISALEDLAAAHWQSARKVKALAFMRQAESAERAELMFGPAAGRLIYRSRLERYQADPLAALEPLLQPEAKVEMLRVIVEDNLLAYGSLASALERLGESLIVSRRYADEAIGCITEATEIWKKLAESSPLAYSVRLREALITSAQMLLRGNRVTEARRAFDEALEAHQGSDGRRRLIEFLSKEDLDWLMKSRPEEVVAKGRALVLNAEDWER